MILSDLVSTVRQNVFPEGFPEELDDRHKNVIIDALIDLQKRVKCFQTDNRSVYNQEETFFSCGATVFDAPRGFLKRLYTVIATDFCSKVFYTGVDEDEFNQRLAWHESCGKSYSPTEYYDDLPYYVEYANSGDDKTCRATEGWWTLSRGQIWMFPHINSTEQVILEWDGVKRSWADADEITFHDREVEQAVEYYLESDAYRHDDCDRDKYLAAMASYAEKRADLIATCKKERIVPEQTYIFNNCKIPA